MDEKKYEELMQVIERLMALLPGKDDTETPEEDAKDTSDEASTEDEAQDAKPKASMSLTVVKIPKAKKKVA